MLEKEQETSAVDHGEEARVWQEKLSEIGRKRVNFQELAAEGFMTKVGAALEAGHLGASPRGGRA